MDVVVDVHLRDGVLGAGLRMQEEAPVPNTDNGAAPMGPSGRWAGCAASPAKPPGTPFAGESMNGYGKRAWSLTQLL